MMRSTVEEADIYSSTNKVHHATPSASFAGVHTVNNIGYTHTYAFAIPGTRADVVILALYKIVFFPS